MLALPMISRVGVALVGLAYLLPGHYLPWLTFHSQWLCALGAACMALAVAQAAAREGTPRPVAWSPIAGLAVLSAAVPMLQWLVGKVYFLSDAVLPALYLLAWALAMSAGATWRALGDSRWLDELFAALIAAAVASVLIALLQWLGLGTGGALIADLPRGGRPFANLGQPNHLATLLALGLVGLVRGYEVRRWSATTVALVSAWLGFGLVMAQSRTGWLFVVGLVLWWALMRHRAGLRMGVTPMLAGAGLFAVAVLAWDSLQQMLLLAQVGGMDERIQVGPRDLIWRACAEALLKSPWTGYGWNQVTLAQQAVALNHAAIGRMFQNAHNSFLDLALWAGLPFALLWTLFLGAWLARRLQRCAEPGDWSTLAAIGAIGLHAMVEYPLEQTYFLLPLGLFMGWVSRDVGLWRGVRAPVSTLAVPLVLMLGALSWIGFEYLKVEQANRDVRLMLAGFGLDKVPHVPPPKVRLLDGPREYHRFMITPASPGMSDDELEWMQRVAQRNAYPPAMFRQALAFGLNGRAGDASLTLQRLCRMHPVERCEEAHSSWSVAQQQHPKLLAIPLP